MRIRLAGQVMDVEAAHELSLKPLLAYTEAMVLRPYLLDQLESYLSTVVSTENVIPVTGCSLVSCRLPT
jgi:hypothetical protein